MIKINRGEDIIDIITGDIDLISSVYYYSSADESVEIEPIISMEENQIVCKLPSDELAKLQTGQLCCSVVLASEDSDFPDGEDTQIQNLGLPIWLR